jgi:thiamine biosynthesis lipoprotein
MSYLNLLFLSLSILCYSTSYSQNKVVFIEGEAQGTTYHITYYDKQDRNFEDEISKLLFEFDLSLSTYNPNSIISKINNIEKDVVLDDYFLRCFKKGKELWKNTNGAFDPTVYPLVNAWGFGPKKKIEVTKEKIDSILAFVGFDLINIKEGKIVKTDPRVSLDFNAFAQGYSVDIVRQFFNTKNIDSYIIEIGGEVYAKGLNDKDFWLVGIEIPIANQKSLNSYHTIVKLENKAIATSGNYRRYIIENGEKIVHHIDPKTGYPTKNNLLSVTIISDSCIISDATATGILVMGLKKARKYLKKYKEIEALIIYMDRRGIYKTFLSDGFKKFIVSTEK